MSDTPEHAPGSHAALFAAVRSAEAAIERALPFMVPYINTQAAKDALEAALELCRRAASGEGYAPCPECGRLRTGLSRLEREAERAGRQAHLLGAGDMAPKAAGDALLGLAEAMRELRQAKNGGA